MSKNHSESSSTQRRKFFSSSEPTSISQRFFGYTAPLPGTASEKKRKAQQKYLNEMAYIHQISSRFSLADPSVYIQNATPGVFEAHIQNEIKIQKEKIKNLKNSEDYLKFRELCIRREILANELLRLEHDNAQILQESQKAAQKLSKYIYEISDPKMILDLRTANNYQDEYERLLTIYNAQTKALQERKRRKFLMEMSEESVKHLLDETDNMKNKTILIRRRIAEKKKKDEFFIEQLNRGKKDCIEKIVRFYNDDNKDIEVSLADVMKYVHEENPIILLRRFQKYKADILQKKLEAWADSSLIEEPPEKQIFKI